MADENKLSHAGFRDAIHVPYVVVTCEVDLHPGQKCSLRHQNRCVKWIGVDDDITWHGVADPFVESVIHSGELFRLFIRKECFRGMRHEFEIEVHDRGGTDTCHQVCDIF